MASHAGALGTIGRANFVDLATVVAGDGRWSGARGQIRISGRFPTATRDGDASYTGMVCPS